MKSYLNVVEMYDIPKGLDKISMFTESQFMNFKFRLSGEYL